SRSSGPAAAALRSAKAPGSSPESGQGTRSYKLVHIASTAHADCAQGAARVYGEGMGGVSRRQALAGLGSVGLAALVAACSDDDDSAADATTPRTEAQKSEPPPSSSGDLASRFDDAARCTRTAEETA